MPKKAAPDTVAGIMQEIERLQAKAEQLQREERDGVVEQIKKALDHYGITAEELYPPRSASRKTVAKRASAKASTKPLKKAAAKRASPQKGAKVAPKYRDEAGNTWTGRGTRPVWLRTALEAGATLEQFAIKE